MKIKVCDTSTEKPVQNTRVQVQVKGKDSGYSSFTTDQNGIFDLDDKFRGQQIGFFLQGQPSGEWVTASDNATLMVDSKRLQTSNQDKAKAKDSTNL